MRVKSYRKGHVSAKVDVSRDGEVIEVNHVDLATKAALIIGHVLEPVRKEGKRGYQGERGSVFLIGLQQSVWITLNSCPSFTIGLFGNTRAGFMTSVP